MWVPFFVVCLIFLNTNNNLNFCLKRNKKHQIKTENAGNIICVSRFTGIQERGDEDCDKRGI